MTAAMSATWTSKGRSPLLSQMTWAAARRVAATCGVVEREPGGGPVEGQGQQHRVVAADGGVEGGHVVRGGGAVVAHLGLEEGEHRVGVGDGGRDLGGGVQVEGVDVGLASAGQLAVAARR